MKKRAAAGGGIAGAPNNLNNLIMGRRVKATSLDRDEILNLGKMYTSSGKNENQSSSQQTIKTVDFQMPQINNILVCMNND